MNPGVRRLLDVEGETDKNLGRPRGGWGYQIIKLIGNDAEIFNRSLGPDKPLDIPRSLDALWMDGDLQQPMPVRQVSREHTEPLAWARLRAMPRPPLPPFLLGLARVACGLCLAHQPGRTGDAAGAKPEKPG